MSPTRDWDAELKKIDRQISSMPDDKLVPQTTAPAAIAATPPVAALPARTTSTLGVMARLILALIVGGAMLFWPYPIRCGMGLFGYLAATGVVAAAGLWASVWTWKHRAPKSHALSLIVLLWGGVLAAREVLPRVGYAIPTEAHPTTWFCK